MTTGMPTLTIDADGVAHVAGDWSDLDGPFVVEDLRVRP